MIKGNNSLTRLRVTVFGLKFAPPFSLIQILLYLFTRLGL